MPSQIYGPAGGAGSSIGPQGQTHYYDKAALISVRPKQVFSQLSSVKNMPKNMGKTIKKHVYLPLLSSLNTNDQGIDANGVAINAAHYFLSFPTGLGANSLTFPTLNAIAAVGATKTTFDDNISGLVITFGGANSAYTGYATSTITALAGFTPSNSVRYATLAKADAVIAAFGAVESAKIIKQQGYGNLYGGSKDTGAIVGRLPVLSETGGKVNQVGYKRTEVSATLTKFGFFSSYTQDSMDFDSDPELQMHIRREMLDGATEIYEAALQADLLRAANTSRFAGGGTSFETMNNTAIVSYTDLIRLSADLDALRCPKTTTAITGTRMVDTKTVSGGRLLYCGSEMLLTLKKLTDFDGKVAWIPSHQYAANQTLLNGEEGAIGPFRVIVVDEMQKYTGVGADASAAPDKMSTGNRFDVFPLMVVGDGSFTTIGFTTDGKQSKFTVFHKKPGEEIADMNNPYGEEGFMSIKWYYATLIERPERIAVLKTIAYK